MLSVKLLEVIYSPTSSITYWQIAYASGSLFFHIQIQLTFTERQVVWPSQHLTVPQRLFCGRVSAPYGNNFWGSRGSQTAFRFHKWPSNNKPWILLIFLESQSFLLAKQMYKFNLSCVKYKFCINKYWTPVNDMYDEMLRNGVYCCLQLILKKNMDQWMDGGMNKWIDMWKSKHSKLLMVKLNWQ